MIIGIDANCWANKRGYGRYTRELVGALLALDRDNEYRLFLDRETAGKLDDLPEGVEQVIVGTSQAASQAAAASGRRSIRDLWAMRQAVHQRGKDLDLFFFPSVYTYFPPKTGAKVIVTIHDTTAERFPRLIFPNRSSQLFWKLKVQMAVRRANLIATVSQASKREIVRYFGVPQPKVQVISDAVGQEFFPLCPGQGTAEALAKYGVGADDRFILYVGGISPHKNLPTLVEAHARLVRQTGASDVKLVLLGDYQQDVFFSSYSQVQERIRAAGTGDRVVFTGFVDDADLPHFYHAALALCMPSFDEGFGLPVLEAMACGTPVAASRAGALPEVVGEAGRLFDPDSPEQLERALAALVRDPQLRQELSRQGLERVKQFSWECSARAALEVFDSLVRSHEPATA